MTAPMSFSTFSIIYNEKGAPTVARLNISCYTLPTCLLGTHLNSVTLVLHYIRKFIRHDASKIA
jgi:hypothetical protein